MAKKSILQRVLERAEQEIRSRARGNGDRDSLEKLLTAYIQGEALNAGELSADGKKPHGFWKVRANVVQELQRVTQKLGHFPSHVDLHKLREWTLVQGIRNYHEGSLLSFRAEMGYAPADTKPAGYWQEWGNLRQELESIVESRGCFPTTSELQETGRRDILGALRHHGTLTDIRKKMGYGPPPTRSEQYRERLQAKVGGDLKGFLQKAYGQERKSTYDIAEELEISQHTVSELLHHYEIPLRSISETRLPKDFKKPSKKQLRQWYLHERKSTIAIAEELGISSGTVSRWLGEYEIPQRDASERILKEGARKPSKTELEREYTERNMTQSELAKKYLVDAPTIGNWLRKYGIPVRGPSEARLPPGFKKPTRERLEHLYKKTDQTLEKIAESLGISKKTLLAIMDEYGIERTRKAEWAATDPGKDELERLYVDERKSAIEVGKVLGTTPVTVRRLLRKYDIPIRGLSESRLPKGIQRPTAADLKRWYVDEKRTTVDIAEELGVSSTCIQLWFKQDGVEVRDKRGMYDDKKVREREFKDLLRRSGKSPQNLTTTDFTDTTREDETSYNGLLGWYRRNHSSSHKNALEILLTDLTTIRPQESVHYQRRQKTIVRQETLTSWRGYTAAVKKMYAEHPELGGELPTTSWMTDNGYNHLAVAAKFHGGLSKVRAKMGGRILRRDARNLRDLDVIIEELRTAIRINRELKDAFPSQTWLMDHGYGHIVNAVRRHHGGFDSVRERMGYGSSSSKEALGDLLKNYAGTRT